MKKLISILLFILITSCIFGQNQVQIVNQSVIPGQVFYVQIEVNNTDPFVALQLDLPIPDVFSLVDQSVELNPIRMDGHEVQFSVITGGAIRILCYSANNSPFIGNSDWLVRFQLEAGTVPGNYDLSPQDILLGNDQGANILSGSSTGTIQIVAPEIFITPMELNFGETAVSQQTGRSFTIQNNGTQTLVVTNIIIPDIQFTANIQVPFNINAGQSSSVTITFIPTWKGQFIFPVTIQSDDPDEPTLEINIMAQSYTINEIHVGSMFAFSGDEGELLVSLNNMEEFVAVQFDLVLPDPLQYIDGSVIFIARNTNHEISAQQLENNQLRVVAFSPDNSAFTGTDGNFIKIRFQVNGTGGHYSIPIQNGTIGHTDGSNILSALYGGSLEVAAADISCSNSMNFGEVSSLENKTLDLQINNYGSDELVIDHIVFANPSFTSTTTFPLSIPISQNNTISVQYGNPIEGTYPGTLSIFSNDPDESPFLVQLSGETYIPNYLIIPDQQFADNQDIWLEVWVENYENFVALQFDLNYPSNIFDCLTEQTELSTRLPDHQLQVNENQDGIIKVLIYSLNQTPASGQDGSVMRLKFTQDQATEGTFDFTLSNSILGNAASEDILYGTRNGQVTTINLPYAPILGRAENITQTGSSISWEMPNGSPVPESFLIDVSDNPDFTSFFSNYDQLDIGQVYSYDLINLFDNRSYFCRLRSLRANFPGPLSNVISFNTLPYIPWPVTLNEADQITTTGARLSWTQNVNGGDPLGYKLEISYDSEFTNYVPGYELLDINNVTEFIANDLLPCILYHFRILPYNEAGNGETSIIKTFTTLSIPPEPPVCSAPANTTSNSFEANWEVSKSGCDPTGYFLEVATDDQFISKVSGYEHIDVGLILSYEVTELHPETNYYYRVQGYNTGGNGAYSNLIEVTTLKITIEINKELNEGWTWFSLNGYNQNMNIDEVLSSLTLNENDYIKSQRLSSTYYEAYNWFGNLLDLNNRDMYKILLNQSDLLEYTGYPVEPAEVPIEISAGWTWVAYTPQYNLLLSDALTTLNLQDLDYIKNQRFSSTYYEGYGWFGNLEILFSNDGYMIKSAESGTLIYPPQIVSATQILSKKINKSIISLFDFNPSLYKYNGNLTAEVLINEINSGSSENILFAFTGNKCIGQTNGQLFPPTGEYVYNLMIYSNIKSTEKISFRFYNIEENQWYEFKETLKFESDMVEATAYEPFGLKNGSAMETDWMTDNRFSFEVYPNPFLGILNISFTNSKYQIVRIAIYDSYGRKVRVIEDKLYQLGTHKIDWDGKNLPDGVYYIRMEAEGFVGNQKVVKVK